MTTDGVARPFVVLLVCTGNICRSPLADQLLNARLREAGLGGDVVAASAGLHAMVGSPMDEIPAELSLRFGGDPSRARGRQLTATIIDVVDLVLTMTQAQRDDLLRQYPRAARRTFTIAEFELLLPFASADATEAGTAIPDALKERVAELARSRSRVRLTAANDVADPYRQPRGIHEAVGEQLNLATTAIARQLSAWARD